MRHAPRQRYRAARQVREGRPVTSDEKIIDLLTQLVKVTAIQAVSSQTSVTDSARLLKLAGLDNQTIADVLNTSSATVRTLTANLRLKKRRR
jgi:DNA-binding NarL/FixJ family response regulator